MITRNSSGYVPKANRRNGITIHYDNRCPHTRQPKEPFKKYDRVEILDDCGKATQRGYVEGNYRTLDGTWKIWIRLDKTQALISAMQPQVRAERKPPQTWLEKAFYESLSKPAVKIIPMIAARVKAA